MLIFKIRKGTFTLKNNKSMKHIWLTLILVLGLCVDLSYSQWIDLTKEGGSNYIILVNSDTLVGTHTTTHTAANRLVDEAIALGVYDSQQSRIVRSAGSNWFVVSNQDTLVNTYLEQYTAIEAMVNSLPDPSAFVGDSIRAYRQEELRLTNTGNYNIRAVRNERIRLDRLDFYWLDNTIYEEVVDTVYVTETDTVFVDNIITEIVVDTVQVIERVTETYIDTVFVDRPVVETYIDTVLVFDTITEFYVDTVFVDKPVTYVDTVFVDRVVRETYIDTVFSQSPPITYIDTVFVDRIVRETYIDTVFTPSPPITYIDTVLVDNFITETIIDTVIVETVVNDTLFVNVPSDTIYVSTQFYENYVEVIDTVFVDTLDYAKRGSDLLRDVTDTFNEVDSTITVNWISDGTFNDITYRCTEQTTTADSTWWGGTNSVRETLAPNPSYVYEYTAPIDCSGIFSYYIWSASPNWSARYDKTIYTDTMEELYFDFVISPAPEEPDTTTAVSDTTVTAQVQWEFTPQTFDVTEWTQYWDGSSQLSSDSLYITLADTAVGSNVWIHNTIPNSSQMEIFMRAETVNASPHIRALATPYGYAQDVYYASGLGVLQYSYWSNSDPTVPFGGTGMYNYQADIPVNGTGEFINILMSVEGSGFNKRVYIKAWFDAFGEPTEWMFDADVLGEFEDIQGGVGFGAHSVATRRIEYLSVGINGFPAPRPQ